MSTLQRSELEAAAWPPEAAATVSRLATEVRSLRERTDQLERALESRVVIEQAKGILAERIAVSPAEAFEILRRAARSTQVRLHDLAAQVVLSHATPAAVAREIARARRGEG